MIEHFSLFIQKSQILLKLFKTRLKSATCEYEVILLPNESHFIWKFLFLSKYLIFQVLFEFQKSTFYRCSETE